MKEVTRAIIVNEKHDVLIGLRARGMGANLWALIGGKVDADETPEACVAREVKEELGVDYDPSLWKEEADESTDPGTAWKVYYFVGEIHGEIHVKEDEILETKYISKDELDTTELTFGHKRILQLFFSEYFPS